METDPYQTLEERAEHGRLLREQVPHAIHGEWSPGPDRTDPVRLIEEQNHGRLEWLVPVRRWRMSASAFTFFRGQLKVQTKLKQ